MTFDAKQDDLDPAKRKRTYVRRSSAWFEVSKLEQTSFRIRMGGLVGSASMARLSRGLARRQISIVSVHAKLDHDDTWIAELHVESLPGGADPRSLVYVELADGDDDPLPSPLPPLVATDMAASPDHGGTLLLTVEAEDNLGLLGSLLAALAELSLFPVEMHIDTRAGRAHDKLWLCDASGESPSPAALEALRRLLSSGRTAAE